MRNHRMLLCVGAGLVALAAAIASAQTTRPAAGGDGPKLVDIPGLESRPGGAGPAARPAGAQPAGDANAPASTAPAPGAGPQQPGNPFGNYFLLIMLGGIILLYVFMGRSRRKQEARRKQMLESLKKGDKVVTIGGIMGTIIEARPDELTVKVDETNNVRMKFARWAIRGTGEQARKEGEQDNK